MLPMFFLSMWGNWLATVKQLFTCPALFTNFPEIVLELLDLKPVNLWKQVRMKQELCWSPLFVIQYPLQPCYVISYGQLTMKHFPHFTIPTKIMWVAYCSLSYFLQEDMERVAWSLTVGEATEVHHADVYRIGDLFIFSVLEFWSHGNFDVWNMFLPRKSTISTCWLEKKMFFRCTFYWKLGWILISTTVVQTKPSLIFSEIKRSLIRMSNRRHIDFQENSVLFGNVLRGSTLSRVIFSSKWPLHGL